MYKKILLAIDLGDGTAEITGRAANLAKTYDAQLSVLHVVEYIPVEPMGEAVLPAINFEDDLVKTARRRLDDLLKKSGLQDCDSEVAVGSVKSEIIRRASDLGADLIVIGSLERHGLGVLVNLTEDTVLHAASCDVLAVRIKQ
ncbi:MAG: universal stress protein [Gammaproteobacteria bacterium]|nr:universal stress protein [Gammaproteobacteria bacterium]